MASVTLNDLMNPLTKIAQYTGETNKKMDKVIELLSKPQAKVEGKKGPSMEDAKGLGAFSKSIKDLGSSLSSLEGVGEKVKSLNMLSQSIALLSYSTRSLKKTAKALDILAPSIKNLIESVSGIDEKSVKAFSILAESINVFAKGIAKSAVFLLAGVVAIPLLYVSLITLGPLFVMLGKFEERITAGAKALDMIGDSLVSFAIGLVSAALASAVVLLNPMLLVSMVGSITLLSAAVALIGGKEMSKRIRSGAMSLTLMGLGLTAFGIGYGLFALTFPSDIGPVEILMQGLAIAGIGGAVALVGRFGLINALKGALSLAAIGGSLLVFGLGYAGFSKLTEGLEFGDILIQSALLVGIGGIFGLAGLVAPFMIAGAAGFGAAGLALMILAPGLQAMKDLEYTKEDGENLATTLAAVAMAFTGTSPEGGFFGNLYGAFTRVAEVGVMAGAAASYSLAGLALMSLSKGLSDFKNLDFTEEDSKNLALALGSISSAFAQAGGEPSNPGGIFGAVFGNTFSLNAVNRGILSVMDAGDALTSVAKGIIEFQKLVDAKIDFDVVGEAISKTLGFVSSAFASIGGAEMEDSDSWFIFSWDENRVAKGIDAVQGAGNALTDVAQGIIEFDKLVKAQIDFEAVGKAIEKTLGFVSSAFANIGGQETSDSWFVFSWDENTVAKGIDAVKGAGNALIDVAKGITEFDKLVKAQIDWDGVEDAITKTLTFVGEAFAIIGGKEESDGWFVFSWDENLVQKGIEAVSGAGEELKNIATGLKTISEIANPEEVAEKIGVLLTSVGDNFKMLYETNPEINDRMSKVGTFIKDLGLQAKKGNLAKAAEGFQGIADAINSIELEKSDSLGNIFKYASELSKDEEAIIRLTEAVNEIRNIMVAKEAEAVTDTGAAPLPVTQTGTTGEAASPEINMDRLNSTLANIDSTLANLPSAIASIEIKIPED